MMEQPILQVEHLTKYFSVGPKAEVHAVDDVSFTLRRGRTFGLVGEKTIEALNTFNGSTGFLNLYILVLITGSVLSIDRKLLIKSFAGYIPTILGGVVCALGLAGLVGAVTGVGAINAICTFAIPVMGGGNGAGITPMSKMYEAATGNDGAAWYAAAFATISIGNLVAVFCAALLNKLGAKRPSLTCTGRVPGIEGDVDINVFMPDARKLWITQ